MGHWLSIHCVSLSVSNGPTFATGNAHELFGAPPPGTTNSMNMEAAVVSNGPVEALTEADPFSAASGTNASKDRLDQFQKLQAHVRIAIFNMDNGSSQFHTWHVVVSGIL